MKKNYIFVAFVFLFSSVCESSYNDKSIKKLVSELSEKGLGGALRGNNKKGFAKNQLVDFGRALRSDDIKHSLSNSENDQSLLESEAYSGLSTAIWEHAEFIKPGSSAAKAIEKDLEKKSNTIISLIHGCAQK